MPVSMFFCFSSLWQLPWPSLSNWENTLFHTPCSGQHRSRRCSWLAAAVLGAAGRSRSQSTGRTDWSHAPAVVLLAEAEDTLRCNADLLVPDLECLVIVNVDGRIQVRVNADPLRTGQEFPAPVNGPALASRRRRSCPASRRRCQTGGLANVLDIAGAMHFGRW